MNDRPQATPAGSLLAAWTHSWDVEEKVRQFVAPLLRSYPKPPEQVQIIVRRPTRADGCWCYRYRSGDNLGKRPHEHVHELGGCPVEPAGDRYVWLEVTRG